MELIVLPHSLVSKVVILVIELRKAIHFVVLPLSLVVASVLIVELSEAVSHTMQGIPFIPASLLIVQHFVLQRVLRAAGKLSFSDFSDGRVGQKRGHLLVSTVAVAT